MNCSLFLFAEESGWCESKLTFKSQTQTPEVSDEHVQGDGVFVPGASRQWTTTKACQHLDLTDRPPHTITISGGTVVPRMIALDDWLKTRQPDGFEKVPLKRRLVLALVLSYGYLHLGGGPWWPYHQATNSTWLFELNMASVLDIVRPFFAFSPARTVKAPYLVGRLNKEMPSLPIFGKLLLELTIGRAIEWESIGSVLRDLQQEMFAKEITDAVHACIGLEDSTFYSNRGSIRGNERLRLEFVSRVVLKLQHVVAEGYKLTLDELFKVNSNLEITSPLNQNPYVANFRPIRQPRNSTAVQSVKQWCLHDDGQTEHLDIDT